MNQITNEFVMQCRNAWGGFTWGVSVDESHHRNRLTLLIDDRFDDESSLSYIRVRFVYSSGLSISQTGTTGQSNESVDT